MISPDFPLILSDKDRAELIQKIVAHINVLDGYSQFDNISRASLDLNFAANTYRTYEALGLERKTLAQLVTTTRSTTATFETPYTINTAAVNTARISYDFTRGISGLVSESASTNTVLQSKDLSTTWVRNPLAAVAVTTNVMNAPDGTLTADKLSEADTSTTVHDLFQAQTFVAGTTYTFSAYVKAGERFRGSLGFGTSAAFTSDRAAGFNLNTKIINSFTSSVRSGIEEYANGWFLVWVTATADASGVGNVYIRLRDDNDNANYAGVVGNGFFVTDVQNEAQSFPTSRIPTTTAAVTRTAGSHISTLPVTMEGTIIAIASGNFPVVGINQAICALSDGTTNNRVVLRRNNSNAGSNYLVVSGGNVQVIGNSPTQKVRGQRNKYAISWKNGAVIAVEDGVSVINTTLTATSVVSPLNMTQLSIGAGVGGGTEHLNGTIERLVFIPRALSELELRYLTTNA